jgi:hypothetical protein
LSEDFPEDEIEEEELGKDYRGDLSFFVSQKYGIQKLRNAAFGRIVAHCKANFPIEVSKASQTDSDKAKAEVRGKYADMAREFITNKRKPPAKMEDLIWYFVSLRDTEKEIDKKLNDYSKEHPLRTEFLDGVYGIGGVFSAGLIAKLDPISRFDTISKLWAYAGLSTQHFESMCEDGHKFITTSKPENCPIKTKPSSYGGERKTCGKPIKASLLINKPPQRKSGYVLCINSKLKTYVWKIVSSFIKQNAVHSQYRRHYDAWKQEYSLRPDLKAAVDRHEKGAKKHIELMTMRRVGKRFLADVWIVWRRAEGLPINKPFPIEKQGHTHYEPPQPDFDPHQETKLKRTVEPVVEELPTKRLTKEKTDVKKRGRAGKSR